MLYEFITTNRDAIIAKTRDNLANPRWAAVSAADLEAGVPIFLSQLSETLRWEATATPFSPTAIGSAAARHGGHLLASGFNLSQVVHVYGDICQAITELALQKHAPIGVEEFHILNRCLDTAIAEAVTEHARVTAQRTGLEEIERLGRMAHELRNVLNTALLAFQTLKLGAVAINGSTGMVLGRSLVALRDLVDSTLCEVRLGAGQPRPQRLAVSKFMDEVAVAAHLHAESRAVHLDVESVAEPSAVHADPLLLASAVMNLLSNAFKHTPAGGRVTLRAHTEDGRVFIDVEDECGGLADSPTDLFRPFAERRGTDQTGLGLGLSIARRAVKADGGDIHVRNVPGRGCVFVIELPLATEEATAAAV